MNREFREWDEFTRKVKDGPSRSLSGVEGSLVTLKVFDLQVSDYLLKPIDEQEFCEAVERAISNINSSKL